MKISQTSNYTLSVFRENILPKLSPLQKKIGVIALIAFGLITACYAFWRCLKPKTEAELAEIAHAAAVSISEKQEEAITKFSEYFMGELELRNIQNFQSAVCFIKGDFEGGKIIQQYIFKNVDGSPVTLDLATEMSKIEKSLKNALNQDLGLHKNVRGLFLIKDNSRKKGFEYVHYSNSGLPSNERISGAHDYSDSEEKLKLAIKILMNIPTENLMKDGEFSPGEFYVDLNAPVLLAAPAVLEA